MLQDVLSILGIANPQLSFDWQDGGSPLAPDSDAPFLLKSNAGNLEWMAPAAGLFNKAFSERIYMSNGERPDENTWVLKLQPQVFARLTRLYSRVLEGKTIQTDHPLRPVPLYFAYHGTTNTGDGPSAGNCDPRFKLRISGGKLSIHDSCGLPIDPLAVASAFLAIASEFPAIVAKDFAGSTAPALSSTQLSQLVTGIAAETRLRLISLYGLPLEDGAIKLSNLSAISADEGLYKLTDATQAVQVQNPAATPAEKFEIGPATNGNLSNSFAIPALAAGINMPRDFVTLFASDINKHLGGEEKGAAPFDTDDFLTPVFHNQSIDFLFNGSQVLSKADQVVRNADGLSLVVSPVIENNFAVAADPTNAEWPVFPAGGTGDIAGRLNDVETTAHFVNTTPGSRDVFLQLTVPESEPGKPQLASGTAIRLYNRKLLADAREGRGNGAGGILNDAFTAGFMFVNPFGLKKNDPLPASPLLLFDLIAVNRVGKKRSFGLFQAKVSTSAPLSAAEQALADRGSNQLNTAPERSISPAGILGLTTTSINTLPVINDTASAVDAALALGDESQPRTAPRLPLMTRNETVVAGRTSAGQWNALLSGLWLRGDSSSNLHRVGAPGSTGGEEFFGIGVHVNGGLLAYELARAAFRRTRGIAARLQQLETDTRWNAPPGTATNSFSAVLLQNISPGADSPSLELVTDTAFNQLPNDWTGLVNGISGIIPAGIAANNTIKNAITSLSASTKGQLLYSEFRRELVTAKHGRRDNLPALKSALEKAQDLVYIETGAFSFTDYKVTAPSVGTNADEADEATDFISLIKARMEANRGLRVLISVSKETFTASGYEVFAARAYDRRLKALSKLKDEFNNRVKLFHPIGFPGRPLRIMHTVVIVDDRWLFVGSGSFNRRGFLFDGNLSMAIFNREIEDGRCKAITTLRRRLLENHLATKPLPGATVPAFVHANEARLADLHECFYAVADMLSQNGAGFIEEVFDGKVTGQPVIPEQGFPHRDLADPDGKRFNASFAQFMQAVAGLPEADA